MVVFAKRMQRLSPQNVPGAFVSIEEHIRYMHEAVEMALRPMQEEIERLSRELEEIKAAQTEE